MSIFELFEKVFVFSDLYNEVLRWREKAFKEMKDIKFLAISERGWCFVVSEFANLLESGVFSGAGRIGVSDLRLTNEVYR